MLNIGVFFGGRSVEHDISILTALEAMSHLNRARYRVLPVYMAPDGRWYTGKALFELAAYGGEKPDGGGLTRVALTGESGTLLRAARGGGWKPEAALDAALLCCHGAYGEDGCLQGLLELAGVPYTSCGVTASALGMDKDFMKSRFLSLGLNVLPHTLVARGAENDLSEVEFPVVVKPASLGSSIGVAFVKNAEELSRALETAFCYDSRVLVERALTDFREINCAAVFDGEKLIVSAAEEPKCGGSVLSFSDKYLTGEKFTGQAQAEREFPARLTDAEREAVEACVRAIYRGFDARGVVRCDFMLKDGVLYANEINTIPGALANYLFGFNYEKLLDVLISAAFTEQKRRRSIVRNFSSSVISGVTGGKIGCMKR